MLYSSPLALSRFVYLRNLSHSASLRLSKPLSSLSQRTLFFSPSRISSSPSRHLRGVSFPFPVSSSSAAPPVCCRFASEMAGNSSQATQTVHDFTVKDARGNDVNLGIYKGKVLLIVNVASQCGLTNSNYTEMATLYEKYKDKGMYLAL